MTNPDKIITLATSSFESLMKNPIPIIPLDIAPTKVPP